MRDRLRFVGAMLAAAVWIAPQAVQAASWRASAGAQSGGWEILGLAFLPNELWIRAGDSITWTFVTDEPHTVTFLTPTTAKPLGNALNALVTPDGSSFDGSQVVSSGEAHPGQTYTVQFPAAGNFKLKCLFHQNMTGAVHVLPLSEVLPHDQAFYDSQADSQRSNLLSSGGHLTDNEQHDSPFSLQVIAGVGEVLSNAGGFSQAAVVRFLPATIVVHAGQTVEWTTLDPVEDHTVTFGFADDPVPPRLPTPVADSGVGVRSNLDSDGARHAFVGSPTNDLHSGRLLVGLADRSVNMLPDVPLTFTDLVQFPLPTTVASTNSRFRVTFPNPGTYKYRCIFHDDLGMKGEVIVLP